MNCIIYSINYCPIKSLSFASLETCIIKKNSGILNDRIFAFSRNIDFEKAKLIERFPDQRKLQYFLTLKNSPFLNKYNFQYDGIKLILSNANVELGSASLDNADEISLICNKLLDLEKLLDEPIFLLHNKDYPFFDTTHSTSVSNSISLINLNSIKDFENNNNVIIESQRFRGNFYVSDLEPWQERKWINKTIKINNVFFKVEKHIARCSATNLQPNSDKITLNLPYLLKKNYNHIDMGVYLTPLNEGKISVGDKVLLDE
jgi:hypothetical protein